MTKPLSINEFYDINKFPKEFGITVLGVSMPYITTLQRPEICFAADQRQIPKIQMSGVGAHVVYSDGLYLNTNDPAGPLKRKFQKLVQEHKNGYQKLIAKDVRVIPNSFSFLTWSQLVLECPTFSKYLEDAHLFYAADPQFRAYVRADIEQSGREVNEDTVSYILEEVLADYLTAKGKIRLQNEYLQGRHKWILNCYHGKPHRAHVYFHQANPLQLANPKNQYQDSWYDLLNNKLYEFDRLDIDAFDFSK